MDLSASNLIAAADDQSTAAGLRIKTALEPLGGSGSPVKPAVYAGGVYQHDRRYVDFGGEVRQCAAIVIDNVPSQANRLEAALLQHREELGLPELVLDLRGLGLPVHLADRLSSFQFPHRNADAYLRDAELDGKSFPRTEIGSSIFAATALNPQALYEWMPQALIYGFWQAHLGKKRQQTKLARSWVSEIVGIEPASTDTTLLGLKGDPYNLSIDEAVNYDPDDSLDWEVVGADRKGKKSKDSLAELGHGQVPVAGAPAGVSFSAIRQTSTLSLAGLRRIHADTPQQGAAGRALLASVAIYAHVAAFGGAFSLRSGADLIPETISWEWLGSSGLEEVAPLSMSDAAAMVEETAELARQSGLKVGEDWPQPLTLLPRASLAAAIQSTWPDLDVQA